MSHKFRVRPLYSAIVDRDDSIRIPGWEEHLVRRAQQGERVALELLVDTYRTSVRSHAMRMLRDGEDADDAAQETFVKAFRALKGFEAGRPLLPWLLRICTNCCVDAMRDRRRRGDDIERHEHALCDTSTDVEDDVQALADREVVRDAISRLPDRYREIIVMRNYRHMEVCEIAAALDRPEGTVKSWLFRARALLRKDLQPALG